MRWLILLVVLLIHSHAWSAPPGHRKGGKELSTATRLIGAWHSTSVSGDAVSFAVDNIVIEFHHDQEFKATVNLNLGGPDVYQGAFDAKQQQLTLKTQTAGSIPCKVTFEGSKKMIVVGQQHGVTVVFQRGASPADSGGWF